MENSRSIESLPLESAQNTDPGRKRPNNEDWVAGFEPTNPIEIQTSGSLYIVADGVGGASRGERASQYAAERVLFDFFKETNLEPGIRLQNAMRRVCREIFEYAQDSNLSRMATTMVAANIRGTTLTVANVGDSRCYIIRSGRIVQITQDHNYAAELVRNGSLTAEQAKHAKTGNTLLRSIGGDPDVEVDVFGEIDLVPGDLVLLCSDGLTRYAESETLLRLCADGTAEQISRRLIDYANNSGGADNISVYIIKVGSDAGRRDYDEEKTIPTPISLDFIQAKKSAGKKVPPLSSHKPLSRGKIINIGLLSLLVIVLLFGVFYLINRDKEGTDEPGLALLASPTSEFAVVLPVETTTSSPEADPTARTDDPLISPTEISLATDVILTVTPTPQETPTGNPDFKCVYEVQDDDSTSTIFESYGLTYRNQNIERFANCNVEDQSCSDETLPIEDAGNIFSGWYLIIPEEVDEEKCRSVENSYWISVNP